MCLLHVTGGPGQGEDYAVQLAVGQCPRNCIYWVTPMQRVVLEELLERYVDFHDPISFTFTRHIAY